METYECPKCHTLPRGVVIARQIHWSCLCPPEPAQSDGPATRDMEASNG
jgi:hypothetical protein